MRLASFMLTRSSDRLIATHYTATADFVVYTEHCYVYCVAVADPAAQALNSAA